MKKSVYGTLNRSGILAICAIACCLWASAAQAEVVNFVFTSDPHYGITRTFQNQSGVDASTVNRAMLSKMAALQGTYLPNDNKVGAGQAVNFNFMVVTGDFANRNETGLPVATTSWNQFKADYLDAKPLGDIPVYLTPGNHDVSNAIGLKGKIGTIDNAALAGVYNYNNNTTSADSSFLKGFTAYQAGRDQLDYKVTIAGGKIDLMFINMWPDEQTRDGYVQSTLTRNTLLFTHDQPNVEAKHFSTADTTGQKSYEGMITSLGGLGVAPTTIDANGIATSEVSALSDYLLAHPQIKGYFHGNDNANEFYEFGGTNVFRVDSPMKGNFSGSDESLLSFQVVTIDTDAMRMVSREFLWNQGADGVWGSSSDVLAVPEPRSLSVLVCGAAMILMRRRRA